MVTVKIDDDVIGDGKTYFIAEAGLNHNGDIKIAKQLIDSAFDCGADAVKFQTFKTEEFLAKSSQYFDLFKNVELTYEEFGELYDHAKSVGITFFSAPFDITSADALKELNVSCFKIASSDLTNIPLLDHISKFNTPMIISTGLANITEVEEAIRTCQKNGNDKLIILHCVANYPTQPEETNLNAMTTLREKFSLPTGYSDNGDSDLVDLVAVSLGASVIEKHFTLDRELSGPDHPFSIDPDRLKQLISQIRLIEKIKGTGIKSPQKSELENISAIRKSITTKSDLQQNHVLTLKDLSIKRPALGIEPKYLQKVIGKKINKSISKDTPLVWDDLI
jgi:N,N'-diacetyllegionaminate synthase